MHPILINCEYEIIDRIECDLEHDELWRRAKKKRPFQDGKGRENHLASQDIPSWNQIDKWLRELADLQSAGVA